MIAVKRVGRSISKFMERLGSLLKDLPHLDLSGQIIFSHTSPRSAGATCDVFIGHWNVGSKQIQVAIKRVRVFIGKEELVAKVS